MKYSVELKVKCNEDGSYEITSDDADFAQHLKGLKVVKENNEVRLENVFSINDYANKTPIIKDLKVYGKNILPSTPSLNNEKCNGELLVNSNINYDNNVGTLYINNYTPENNPENNTGNKNYPTIHIDKYLEFYKDEILEKGVVDLYAYGAEDFIDVLSDLVESSDSFIDTLMYLIVTTSSNYTDIDNPTDKQVSEEVIATNKLLDFMQKYNWKQVKCRIVTEIYDIFIEENKTILCKVSQTKENTIKDTIVNLLKFEIPKIEISNKGEDNYRFFKALFDLNLKFDELKEIEYCGGFPRPTTITKDADTGQKIFSFSNISNTEILAGYYYACLVINCNYVKDSSDMKHDGYIPALSGFTISSPYIQCSDGNIDTYIDGSIPLLSENTRVVGNTAITPLFYVDNNYMDSIVVDYSNVAIDTYNGAMPSNVEYSANNQLRLSLFNKASNVILQRSHSGDCRTETMEAIVELYKDGDFQHFSSKYISIERNNNAVTHWDGNSYETSLVLFYFSIALENNVMFMDREIIEGNKYTSIGYSDYNIVLALRPYINEIIVNNIYIDILNKRYDFIVNDFKKSITYTLNGEVRTWCYDCDRSKAISYLARLIKLICLGYKINIKLRLNDTAYEDIKELMYVTDEIGYSLQTAKSYSNRIFDGTTAKYTNHAKYNDGTILSTMVETARKVENFILENFGFVVDCSNFRLGDRDINIRFLSSEYGNASVHDNKGTSYDYTFPTTDNITLGAVTIKTDKDFNIIKLEADTNDNSTENIIKKEPKIDDLKVKYTFTKVDGKLEITYEVTDKDGNDKTDVFYVLSLLDKFAHREAEGGL